MCTNYPEPYFSPYKLNMPVVYPDIPPIPGQRIIGYMVYNKPNKCLTTPDLRHYSLVGWLTSIILSCVFLPLACVPCFCSCYYESYQVVVYG